MISPLKQGPRPFFILAMVLFGVSLLALACGGDGEEQPSADDTPTTGETPTGDEATGGTAQINMVPPVSFDKTELTIPANQDVTITADNADGSIQHNFAVYASEDAPIALAATEICSAPCTRALTLNLEPGEYFFRCDVHPFQMTGTLMVEASTSTRY